MLSNLYLLRFNNYYNRILKRYDSIDEYEPYILSIMQGINFIPEDGINTKQILNYNGDIPDYLLVSQDNEIISRWFVIDSKRTRKSQFELTLFRDTLADYLESIQNAPMFIEKAFLQQGDPLIFNQENMTFNQIKTSENLLKDETGCAWLVGYYSKKLDSNISTSFQINPPEPDITVNSLSDYKYYEYCNVNSGKFAAKPTEIVYNVYSTGTKRDGTQMINKISFNKNGGQSTGLYVETSTSDSNDRKESIGCAYIPLAGFDNYFTRWPNAAKNTSYKVKTISGYTDVGFTEYWHFTSGFSDYYSTLENQFRNYFSYLDDDKVAEVLNENGKTMHVLSSDTYWRLRVEAINNSSTPEQLTSNNEVFIGSGNGFDTFKLGMAETAKLYEGALATTVGMRNWSDIWTGNPNQYSFTIRHNSQEYTIYLDRINELEGENITVEFDKNLNYQLEDAPYNMFCIPYGDDVKLYKNADLLPTVNKITALQTCMHLLADNSTLIYDIQLLPYCPVRYIIQDDKTMNVGNNNYVSINRSGTAIGTILFAYNSSFKLTIPYTINVEDYKIQAQTDLWRLCSPNYAGQFEFNAAKNNGVQYITVDCTYKPYTPYIHLAPNFNGLYGEEFDDARGLICGGDFSISRTEDAWQTYELNNKNYQLAFDRQIQNMEVNNKYQRISDIVGFISGTAGGTATGAVGGMMIGGPVGAAAGALMGTSISGPAGIFDVYANEMLRQEALDYTKDMFGYNLGNIQALPYTLNKVSAFNKNNKIFPFIEYYTCTEQERDALIEKIKYNSMTVMKIGTFNDFRYNTYRNFEYQYIKGKLIRLEINDDFHIANVIAEEMNKGVYIKTYEYSE